VARGTLKKVPSLQRGRGLGGGGNKCGELASEFMARVSRTPRHESRFTIHGNITLNLSFSRAGEKAPEAKTYGQKFYKENF